MKWPDPYPDGTAVESAIKQAAVRTNSVDAGRSIAALIRQAHYDRFLCRVFDDERPSDWVLKGGTGVLARVPDARATLDIDLHRSTGRLDQAVAELRRIAARDLGDHFRFIYLKRAPISMGDAQPYLDGWRVTFSALLGAKALEPIKVDLVVGPAPIGIIRTSPPANRLPLPRLKSCNYRIYPAEDQIADKVCATLAQYGGRPSSREKDLVDLVVLAVTTTDLDLVTLRRALRAELARRRQQPFDVFAVPKQWGPSYSRTAAEVPQCNDYGDVQRAAELIGDLLGPALREVGGGTWNPAGRNWR